MLKITTSALALTALMTLGAQAQGTDDNVADDTAEVVEETAEDTAVEAEAEAEVTETDIEVETTTVEVEPTEGDAELAEEPMMDGERPMLRAPAFEREGYNVVELDELTSEDMTGMRIYGPDDEDVGEISELIMSSDGSSVERAILDIGGFLGLGEHQIAVTLDELQIMRDDLGTPRAYIDATQEELEAQPEYDG